MALLQDWIINAKIQIKSDGSCVSFSHGNLVHFFIGYK